MNREDIRAKMAGPDSLWWTYRLLLEVLDDRQEATDADKSAAVDCFLRLAAEDPDWARKALADKGPGGHAYASLLSKDRLTAALARVDLPDVDRDAMLKATMLLSAARWQRKPKDTSLYADAWRHLQRVPDTQRSADWKELAVEATAEADYPTFRRLATDQLAEEGEAFYRSMFLPKALAIASSNRDWQTFDQWLADWNALPESMRHGHGQCAVISLEGMRALDAGRQEDAGLAMQRLLEAAAGETFLSNDEIAGFPKGLKHEGLFGDLCAAFDELVAKRDWRLHAKGKSGA